MRAPVPAVHRGEVPRRGFAAGSIGGVAPVIADVDVEVAVAVEVEDGGDVRPFVRREAERRRGVREVTWGILEEEERRARAPKDDQVIVAVPVEVDEERARAVVELARDSPRGRDVVEPTGIGSAAVLVEAPHALAGEEDVRVPVAIDVADGDAPFHRALDVERAARVDGPVRQFGRRGREPRRARRVLEERARVLGEDGRLPPLH